MFDWLSDKFWTAIFFILTPFILFCILTLYGTIRILISKEYRNKFVISEPLFEEILFMFSMALMPIYHIFVTLIEYMKKKLNQKRNDEKNFNSLDLFVGELCPAKQLTK